MRNIWLIARQEFLTNVRKRSYLITAFGLPIFLGVIYALIFVLTLGAVDADLAPQSVGYVDDASVISADASESEVFVAYDSVEAASTALEAGDITYYAVIPAEYMRHGTVQLYAAGNAPENLQDDVEDWLLASLAAQVDSDISAERLQDPVENTVYLENNQREVSDNAIIGVLIAPLLLAMILFIAIQLSSTFLVQSVVDEKSNRLMEILITSVRPSELLTGKLFGAGGLGLLQLVIWATVGVFGLALLGNRIEALSAIVIPLDMILIGMVYFVLTYFLLGSILAGIGAVVGAEQESRQYASIVSMLVIVPVFFFAQILTEPDSPLVVALTLIPVTAPVTVMFRLGLSSVPPEQLIASLSLMLALTVVVVWFSAKVFRWALLLYGKSITPKTLWHVITGSPEMGELPPEQASQVAEEQSA